MFVMYFPNLRSIAPICRTEGVSGGLASLLVPLFIAKKSIFKSCRGKIFCTRLLLDGDIELIYILNCVNVSTPTNKDLG